SGIQGPAVRFSTLRCVVALGTIGPAKTRGRKGQASFTRIMIHIACFGTITAIRSRKRGTNQKMNAFFKRTLASSALAAGLFAGIASAQADRGGPPEIVIHPTNPHSLGEAVTAGSTATINPPINNHGGPIIGIARPYLIWYGTWTHSSG